jgi:hypothetical protein
MKVAVIALVAVAAIGPALIVAQQTSPAPAASAEELKTYEAFRAWLTKQPADVQKANDTVVFQRYGAELTRQGKSEKDIATITASLRAMGDRAEIERWNQILTAAKPTFNTAPNTFLVAATNGVKPGRSLDVGMGQGRNVGAREFAANVIKSLRPGGMVVVEGFHREATKTRSIGGAVVFDTNELLQIFSGLRVVQYQDTTGVADFGLFDTRVVRLAAVKQ